MDADRSRTVDEDLAYVRRAIAREAASPFPRSVAWLWAAISVVGFAVIDHARPWAPVFWLIASPLGFGLSIWLGRRAAHAVGHQDRAVAARWSLHWAGLLGAFVLVVGVALAGRLDWEAAGSTLLLLLALAYYTAGVHLHRGLFGIAGLLGVGYLVVVFLDGRHWTWIGVAIAAALVATAHVGGSGRRA